MPHFQRKCSITNNEQPTFSNVKIIPMSIKTCIMSAVFQLRCCCLWTSHSVMIYKKVTYNNTLQHGSLYWNTSIKNLVLLMHLFLSVLLEWILEKKPPCLKVLKFQVLLIYVIITYVAKSCSYTSQWEIRELMFLVKHIYHEIKLQLNNNFYTW